MTEPATNIFLIGYRGTGKTTVGRLLAERLGWEFIDADVLLEEKHGRTIKQIFAAEGETGFRDKEAAILAELCGKTRQVIATGGGVILRPDNRALLKKSGHVIWLRAEESTIWQRLKQDVATEDRRPNLTVGGLQEIEDLLKQREPWYTDCAEFIEDTTGQSPTQLVERIVQQCLAVPG